MSIDTATTRQQDLAEALERAATGQRDPGRMRRAIEQMERSREQTRKQIGVVEVAVDLVRDARDR